MIGRKLKFCSWNIHGYKSRQSGIKLKDPNFLSIVEDADVVSRTETHIHDEILGNLSIPGFILRSYKNRQKNVKSGTAAGGIAVFVKQHVSNLISVVKGGNDDIIWIKIEGGKVGSQNDISCHMLF